MYDISKASLTFFLMVPTRAFISHFIKFPFYLFCILAILFKIQKLNKLSLLCVIEEFFEIFKTIFAFASYYIQN